MENREPMMVYDLKRKRSPKTNPIKPDKVNQIQLSHVASVGNAMPLCTKLKTLRKVIPISKRRRLTERDPIL
jgi:hypothetical protein